MMRVGVIAFLIAGLASSSMASHLTGQARSNGIGLPGSTVASDDSVTIPPETNVVNATWTLRHDVRAPDGYTMRVVTVNDEFMPELRVKQGDLLMITVRNEMLNDAAAIHWHGFEQLGTPWSDGAAYVTQCPINRQDFRYVFVAEASPGMLIVEPSDDPPVNGTPQFADTATQSEYIELLNSVDGEIPLFINGWYHEDTDLQLARWQDAPFQLPTVHQSILVNGKGTFDCSLLDCGRASSRCNESVALGPEVFNVTSGGTYLTRLVNADFDSIMFVSVEGHTLTIIAADGRPIVPYETTMVFMEPGQRYDALLTTDLDPDLYNIYITHRPIFGGGVVSLNTTAILAYEEAQGDIDQTFTDATDPNAFPNLPALDWDERNLNNVNELPEDMAGEDAADRTIELFSGLVAPVDEVQGAPNLLWYMGRTPNDTSSFNTGYERSDLGFPVLAAAFHDRMDIYGDSLLYEELGSGEVVDVILHNTANAANLSFNHVFHLHGYHFFVIGIGPGQFEMETHREMLNFVNPPLRDTATLPGGNAGPQNMKGATSPSANGPGNPSSWLYLRFRTQNPGVWFFHCHLGYHRVDRQGMFFIVDAENITPPPSHHPRCGEWFEWEVLDRLEEAGCLAA